MIKGEEDCRSCERGWKTWYSDDIFIAEGS